MALMDSLINAAASAIGGSNQQNTAVQMALDLVRQSGGVGNLINQLQQGGLGSALESWISNGSNESVSGNDLQSALGSGLIEQIASKFGMNGSQASDLLAQYLPNLVDSATPNGSAQDADGFGLDDLAALVLKNLIK
ncbi:MULTISPECIES: YidB family protein [Neisseria]|uniref:Ribosomal protein P2 n=1 Tax=Neisseria dumasiana TaxID=1931275 RepID=A0ABX3WMI8_9NEIS|nr:MULTISPECIES: YidB family protein [Neisseria]KPN73360.1 ribosomal protein P2 [Neisseria sp. 74A18]OSI16126.1 ribosomal protein P2 [Neisseria dumasiana]OSI34718.1 ribosomal protein P2 [Neisseria dumasiana]UOO85488.1 YidB family protein [Neisseria dumasiana]